MILCLNFFGIAVMGISAIFVCMLKYLRSLEWLSSGQF
jgi:hypothetical protein